MSEHTLILIGIILAAIIALPYISGILVILLIWIWVIGGVMGTLILLLLGGTVYCCKWLFNSLKFGKKK